MYGNEDTAVLVRFVLARLDEDRAALRRLARGAGARSSGAIDSVDRLAVECAAKRHSVGAVQRLLMLRNLPTERIVRDEAVVILRAMALPYRAHPMYHDEWRMKVA